MPRPVVVEVEEILVVCGHGFLDKRFDLALRGQLKDGGGQTLPRSGLGHDLGQLDWATSLFDGKVVAVHAELLDVVHDVHAEEAPRGPALQSARYCIHVAVDLALLHEVDLYLGADQVEAEVVETLVVFDHASVDRAVGIACSGVVGWGGGGGGCPGGRSSGSRSCRPPGSSGGCCPPTQSCRGFPKSDSGAFRHPGRSRRVQNRVLPVDHFSH